MFTLHCTLTFLYSVWHAIISKHTILHNHLKEHSVSDGTLIAMEALSVLYLVVHVGITFANMSTTPQVRENYLRTGFDSNVYIKQSIA